MISEKQEFLTSASLFSSNDPIRASSLLASVTRSRVGTIVRLCSGDLAVLPQARSQRRERMNWSTGHPPSPPEVEARPCDRWRDHSPQLLFHIYLVSLRAVHGNAFDRGISDAPLSETESVEGLGLCHGSVPSERIPVEERRPRQRSPNDPGLLCVQK